MPGAGPQAAGWLGANGSDRSDKSYKSYRSHEFNLTDPPNPPDAPANRYLPIILSAIAFWLAFLTKQQAVLFLFGSAAALAWARQWRGLALFAGLSAALCLGSVALLNHATQAWYGYYCFHVPLANGIKLNLAAQFFTIDMPLYAPLLGMIGVLAIGNREMQGSRQSAVGSRERISRLPIADCRLPAFAWCLMGLAGSLLSRAHWGGDQNVLMAGFIGVTLVGCILAARAEEAVSRAAAPLYALALLQLLTLVYRPDAQIRPSPTAPPPSATRPKSSCWSRRARYSASITAA